MNATWRSIPTAVTNRPASAGTAAENQFREHLRREYRLEALKAGSGPAQATNYANALSPEQGLDTGMPEMAPVGRGWFYQSAIRVVKQTLTSGLIELTDWAKGHTNGRTRASAALIFPRGFSPWRAGAKK